MERVSLINPPIVYLIIVAAVRDWGYRSRLFAGVAHFTTTATDTATTDYCIMLALATISNNATNPQQILRIVWAKRKFSPVPKQR
jgi:hypothetical protein